MAKIQRSQAFQKHLSPLKISLHNAQRDLPLSLPHVRKVVSFLLKKLKISTNGIIIHFVRESKICSLHADYFDDPSPTDCITFPLDPPGPHSVMLGEAFICPKTALAYSKRLGVDPYKELYRYVVHCILHMMGYEDVLPRERAKMKRRERACLKKLDQAGLLKKASID